MIRIWNRRGRTQVSTHSPPNRALLSSHSDLFAHGEDFSWETIANGRNRYYQGQLAQQINDQMIDTISLLTSALNIHLNLGQNSTMNTSSLFLSLETVSSHSLSNKQIHPFDHAQIQLPSKIDQYAGNSVLSVRVSRRSIAHATQIEDSLIVVRGATIAISRSVVVAADYESFDHDLSDTTGSSGSRNHSANE